MCTKYINKTQLKNLYVVNIFSGVLSFHEEDELLI